MKPRPWNDVGLLRTHIVPILYRTRMDRWDVCNNWIRNMQMVCKLYGCALSIDPIPNSAFLGEYMTLRGKGRIVLYCDMAAPKLLFVTTFFHELAHHLQLTVMLRVAGRELCGRWGFVRRLQFERTAIRLAYYLAKAYAPNLKLCYGLFACYTNARDKKYLR